jgi:hypothetical protein
MMLFRLRNCNFRITKVTGWLLTLLIVSFCIEPAHAEGGMPSDVQHLSDSLLTESELSIRKTTRLALFIPGAGQLANRNYFKAACVWGGMAYGVQFLIANTQDLKNTRSNLIDAINQNEGFATINALTERETYDQRFRDISWLLLFGIHGLSILDAHVSANLHAFDVSEDLSLRWGILQVHNRSTIGMALAWQPNSKKPIILN